MKFNPIRYIRDSIYNWLEDSDSIQFDTDLPLEDCIQRLRHLAASADIRMELAIREFTLERVEDARYRLRIMLASFPRVRLDAVLWQDEGITFVNGEAILYRKSWLYLPGLIGVAFLAILLFTRRPELVLMAVLLASVVMMGLIGSIQPTIDYRTTLINLIYDTLDHEQVTRPDIAEPTEAPVENVLLTGQNRL